MRAPLRAPKIDKIEFSMKKFNFLPFSRNLHLIVKVTSKCIQWSVHEWKYSQCEIFSCWYQEICARSGAREISTTLMYFVWRGFHTSFSEEVFIRFSLKRFLYDFLWSGFYTVKSPPRSKRFVCATFFAFTVHFTNDAFEFDITFWFVYYEPYLSSQSFTHHFIHSVWISSRHWEGIFSTVKIMCSNFLS